ANTSAFVKSDQTRLNEIPLNGKFTRLITNHPAGSYKITHADKKHDNFTITSPTAFWSESKYLIIQIK
ncbi:MAG: hypothetical protein ACHQIM_20225, partial [Sphingobacteriales bacterium]